MLDRSDILQFWEKMARQVYGSRGKIFLTVLFGRIITLRQLITLQILPFVKVKSE